MKNLMNTLETPIDIINVYIMYFTGKVKLPIM